MRVIDRLSKSQRVVVVVALGLALGVIGTYLTSQIRPGWYGYAPLTTTSRLRATGFRHGYS